MVWEYGPQGQTEEAAGRTQGPPAAAPRTQYNREAEQDLTQKAAM